MVPTEQPLNSTPSLPLAFLHAWAFLGSTDFIISDHSSEIPVYFLSFFLGREERFWAMHNIHTWSRDMGCFMKCNSILEEMSHLTPTPSIILKGIEIELHSEHSPTGNLTFFVSDWGVTYHIIVSDVHCNDSIFVYIAKRSL